jgi:hypothetical protein
MGDEHGGAAKSHLGCPLVRMRTFCLSGGVKVKARK